MASPLFLVEGLFDQLLVHTDTGQVCLQTELSGWVGKKVEAHLHHLPLDPADPSLPGGGSCMWNGYCPHGHQENPGWLFHQQVDGVLAWNPPQVGDDLLGLDVMSGHRGRLFVLDLDFLQAPPHGESVGGLMQEAADMSALLQRLRKVVR
jgi:hypothetical protein